MRSARIVDKGAERYVVGNVDQYNQKNEMFKRPFWDPEVRDVGKKFYFTPVMPKDKPGYRLSDMALTNASWRLETEYAAGVHGGRMGFYDWDWNGYFSYPRVAPGLKISTDGPEAVTRQVKKTAGPPSRRNQMGNS